MPVIFGSNPPKRSNWLGPNAPSTATEAKELCSRMNEQNKKEREKAARDHATKLEEIKKTHAENMKWAGSPAAAATRPTTGRTTPAAESIWQGIRKRHAAASPATPTATAEPSRETQAERTIRLRIQAAEGVRR